jgi:hypothetical protein
MTLQERIDALHDKNMACWTAYPSVSNAAKWYADLKELPADVADMLLTAVESADAAIKKQQEDTQYIKDRLKAYPSIGDQLDKIFHDGIDAWKAEIQAIKNTYPKPE